MARIKVEEVLDSLGSDLRVALGRTVRNLVPGAVFDDRSLYQAFVREAYRKCSIWEEVPDSYIEKN